MKKQFLLFWTIIFSVSTSFAQVAQQWAAMYNGTGNGNDNANAMTIDASGNVFVTGYATNSTGTTDYVTIKYNTIGIQQWISSYNGTGNNDDKAIAIAVDGSGNVYVTGYSWGASSNWDYATIKYNSSGVQQWIRTYNGSGNNFDLATSIAVDGSGNVYVTGQSTNSVGNYDYVTLKYNNSGTAQWISSYNGIANGNDDPHAMAIDGSGNVYVTGQSGNASGDYDYGTVKYNSNGVMQWVNIFNGPGNNWDIAKAISVDANGSSCVTGFTTYANGTTDYATIKYNSGGVQQWLNFYNGTGNSIDNATAITSDASGNVYVTGTATNSGFTDDFATVKYDNTGAQLWVAFYNIALGGHSTAAAITLDGSGNVYVTGVETNNAYVDTDFATAKFNNSGVQQWSVIYNGSGNNFDQTTAIAVDGSGNVYVSGYAYGTGNNDYATLKYSQTTSPLTVTQSQTNLNCNGICNGTATVVASGGTAPYTYSWIPSGPTSSTITFLCAGGYTCTITDATLTSVTATFLITQPSSPLTATSSQTNVLCNGGNDGTATAIPTGGTPGYTYSWSPVGGNAATATGLNFGSYTCTITDANGCTTTVSVTLTEPTALSVTSVHNDVLCFNGNTGDATVNVNGGILPYTYSWSSGGSAATESPLVAGSYTCTINDANGCSISESVTITEPPALTLSSSQVNLVCNGNSTGSATVNVSGGTPSYTYSWTPFGGSNATANALAAGTYTCLVTDANGCAISQVFVLTQPSAISASVSQTDILCNGGNNGSATLNVSGGNPGYTYLWSPIGGTASTASGLSAGTYSCTITDASSCVVTQTVTITQPATLTATTMQTNVTCFGANNGDAMVMVSGGTSPYTYSWSPSGGNAASANGLSPGTYSCTITDFNGCILTQTVTITEPSLLSNTSSQIDVMCNGGNDGSITLTVSGGTSAYTYSWSPSGGNAATASGLIAGTYTCLITDANGCSLSPSFTITEPPALNITATASSTSICNGSSTTLSASGASTYQWMPGSLGGSSIVVSPSSSTTYTVTGTDASGCSNTNSITITVNPIPVVNLGPDVTICSGTITLDAGNPGETFLWNDNSNFQTLLVSSSGIYFVDVTNSFGCSSRDSVTVNYNSNPVVALGPDVAQCGGSVLLDAGLSGASYLWNTGATTQTISPTTSGIYFVTATLIGGCTASDTISITIDSFPIVNLGADISQCGGPITLNAGNPGANYLWNTNATSQTISVTTSGIYFVDVTNSSGCISSDTISITLNSNPIVNLGPNIAQCGGSVTLDAGNPGASYSWSTGATTQTITVNASGTYSVTDTLAGGCFASDAILVTIHTPPVVSLSLGQDTACVTDGAFLLTGGNPSGGFYIGPGVAGGYFFPATAGVSVNQVTYLYTDGFGCMDSTTQNVVIEACTGIEQSTETNSIFIYPNPNNGLLTVNISGMNGETILLELFTVEGKIIYSAKENVNSDLWNKQLDISTFADGTYFMKIISNKKIEVRKILKQ